MGYRQRSRSDFDPGRLGELLEASGPRSGPAKGQSGCPTQSGQAPHRGPIRGYEPPPPVGAGCLGGRQPPLVPFHGAPPPTPLEEGALRVRSRRPLAHARGHAVRSRGIPPQPLQFAPRTPSTSTDARRRPPSRSCLHWLLLSGTLLCAFGRCACRNRRWTRRSYYMPLTMRREACSTRLMWTPTMRVTRWWTSARVLSTLLVCSLQASLR